MEDLKVESISSVHNRMFNYTPYSNCGYLSPKVKHFYKLSTNSIKNKIGLLLVKYINQIHDNFNS